MYNSFEEFQLRRYGNVIPEGTNLPEEELFEAGIDQLGRLSEWIGEQADQQLEQQAN